MYASKVRIKNTITAFQNMVRKALTALEEMDSPSSSVTSYIALSILCSEMSHKHLATVGLICTTWPISTV